MGGANHPVGRARSLDVLPENVPDLVHFLRE
jgi:hypothetical protein